MVSVGQGRKQIRQRNVDLGGLPSERRDCIKRPRHQIVKEQRTNDVAQGLMDLVNAVVRKSIIRWHWVKGHGGGSVSTNYRKINDLIVKVVLPPPARFTLI